MSRIIMFSDLHLPTFPFLEIPLYKELVSKKIDVQYVLREGDIRLTDSNLSGVFAELNPKTIKKPTDILSLLRPQDLLLMRFVYKGFGGDVGYNAVGKHKVLMYDPGGIDIRVRAGPAQYLAAKSNTLRKATLKKFPKHYKSVFAVGTIHYDAVANIKVDRSEFMHSYGLDSNKKLVLVTPANPGEMGHQFGIDNEYRQIIDVVKKQCPDYEIMVKGHPLDYTASMPAQPGIIHKNDHYNGKHSWEKFYPGATVVKAEEGYKAIKACDAVLNVRSSIAMETPLFPKPLININRHKYTTNWVFDPGAMIDIKMEELADVLNNNRYSVDAAACKKYCQTHCFSDDGQAYVRTADIAIKILKGEI